MMSRREFGMAGTGALLAQTASSGADAQGSRVPASSTTLRTMRAAQMTGFRNPLRIVEVPVASPRSDGAVVQVEACGVCRSITITAADLNCISLPEWVDSLSAATLGCRYMTAYRGVVHRGRVAPGAWVAVQGCGGVGLSAVQIAAAMGGLVVAVDVGDRKLGKARDEGAVVAITARGLTPQQVGQAVKEATGGGVDVSIDALGRGFTAQQSVQSLRKRGRHVQIGLTSQEERGLVAMPIDDLVNNEWEMVGSLGNPHPNYPELLALVAEHKLNPASLVTRQIALSDVTDTLQRMTRFDTIGFEVITRFS